MAKKITTKKTVPKAKPKVSVKKSTPTPAPKKVSSGSISFDKLMGSALKRGKPK